ncbi:hypothetical protein GGS20DRAFT_544710 [Poronia punctata]|nr:hypothetical protein GGS20DRAFT_544710 [Poronia punctata]
MAYDEWSDYDEPDEIPLQDKRPFGSGLKRKRVVFVPASSTNTDDVENNKPPEPSKSVSDIYLSIVLPKEADITVAARDAEAAAQDLCEVCKLPLGGGGGGGEEVGKERSSGRPHEASIAHQVCLIHSHPPSALDRSRMGLSVLQAQGWDPDARTGLGASQQGVSFPIKAKPKYDKLGLGVEVPKDIAARKKEKPKLLDAKKARKMAADDKKRHERLRHQFYGNGELEKYLGPG